MGKPEIYPNLGKFQVWEFHSNYVEMPQKAFPIQERMRLSNEAHFDTIQLPPIPTTPHAMPQSTPQTMDHLSALSEEKKPYFLLQKASYSRETMFFISLFTDPTQRKKIELMTKTVNGRGLLAVLKAAVDPSKTTDAVFWAGSPGRYIVEKFFTVDGLQWYVPAPLPIALRCCRLVVLSHKSSAALARVVSTMCAACHSKQP